MKRTHPHRGAEGSCTLMSTLANAFTPLDLPAMPRGSALGDEVFKLLGDAIVDGRLAPGERVRDQELAQRLGISRTPVREAIQRLERAGLIEVSPHRYTRVTLPNDKVQADTFEMVAFLMGAVIQMACARCSDDTIEAAVVDAESMIDASRRDNHYDLVTASYDFFENLTNAAGNIAVQRYMEESEISIRRNFPRWKPALSDVAHRTTLYETFRDALKVRDADQAENAMREINALPRSGNA